MKLSDGKRLDLSGGRRYVLDSSDPPAFSIDDVRALLPAYAQEGDDSTMRRAVLEMWKDIGNFLWYRFGIALNALRSPRYASGIMLDVWGEWLKRPRAPDETEGEYRQRLLLPQDGITPEAIEAVVDALVAEVTNIKAAYQEPAVDGAFVTPANDPACPWASFVQGSAARLWNLDPSNPNQTAGGYVVPEETGAQGWVISPETGDDDGLGVFAMPDDAPAEQMTFIGSDADDVVWSFVTPERAPLSEQIISEVNARKGFGVAWMLLLDPLLASAK